MKRRDDWLEATQNKAKSHGGRCLSTSCYKATDYIELECLKGHRWRAQAYNIVNSNRWCNECAKESVSTKNRLNNGLEIANKIAIDYGGKCLDEKYINNRVKILWECRKGHRWYASLNVIKDADRWCPACAGNKKLTIQDCRRLAEKHKGRCLSNEYINSKAKYLWECKENHRWHATYNSINNGCWCPYCANRPPINIECCHKVAQTRDGKCLSIEYINTNNHLLWECKEKHTWFASFNNVKQGTWCPKCKTRKTQKKLTKILHELIKESPITIRPYWLKNPETNYPLEIDIYFPEHKIAVEYNGGQHYKPVDFAGRGKKWAKEQLKNIQSRDKIKQELIKQNPDKVKHFIIFSYKDVIEKENVKNILIKKGILQCQ